MISFIIPAHNEEAYIGATLESVHVAAEALGEPYEVIVVNDDSTDRTTSIAARQGAQVVMVELRQIAAVRNAGARQARGEVLLFLDADTRLPAETLRQAWTALRQGAVGGGARVSFDEWQGFGAAFALSTWNFLGRVFRWAAGCCVYVRRDVFDAAGGFSEKLFAAEEIAFSESLKRRGPFHIAPHPVITSARKMASHGAAKHWAVLVRVILTGGRALQQREGLDVWYDGKRS